MRTEKFIREREAQRALLGKYRNRFTDAVEFKVRSTANTNIFYFNGKLLACKEDSPPYAMNPYTLETIGLENFDGQLPSLTFTAHPKLDPRTGELVCFGYEAKGDGTPDVCYYSISPDGKFTEVVWLVAPEVAMIHDFAVTQNYVVFPLIPQTCDFDRLKAGGEHWQWNSAIPFYIGVLPRRGATGSDVKVLLLVASVGEPALTCFQWFRAPNAFPGHTSNAYETSDGRIVLDLPLSDQNVFFWWPDADGNAPDPRTIRADLVRFHIDPKADNLILKVSETILNQDCEFPRIDDRFSMSEYEHCFFDLMDLSLGTEFEAIAPVMGGGYALYNAIGHLNVKTGHFEKYFPGPRHMVQECVFIPKGDDAKEGDGFVMFLVNNYQTMSSELHILDTEDFQKAVAKVFLPMRLRAGLHGNWVDGQDLALIDRQPFYKP